MDIVINANTDNMPENARALTTQGECLHNLMVSLGFPVISPPSADFLRQSYGLEGRWLLVEPIYWEATHNDARIVAMGSELALTETESRDFFNKIAAFLAEEGLTLFYHSAHSWLLKAKPNTALQSLPTALARKQPLLPLLKNMDPSLYWQRLMTELQMFLHVSPYQRRGTGCFPMNGLWVYDSPPFTWNNKIRLITEDARLLLAFPNKIEPLFTKPLTNESVVFINSFGSSMLPSLQAIIGKHSAQWFWNNKAYRTPTKRWWHRFK